MDEVELLSQPQSFRLAPMCRLIRILTIVLWGLPCGFLIGALSGEPLLGVPALLTLLIYGWVWLRLRPTRFIVHPERIEIIWPAKRRELLRSKILSTEMLTRDQLKQKIGWGMRVGAGGLWGGFGWLWTQHRGIAQMYVSRLDWFVWIELAGSRPWLITPEEPEGFVRSMQPP
jgi:hypothetical protein